MKILDLLQHENFEQIIEQTLGQYLSHRFSQKFTVKWIEDIESIEKMDEHIWFCNYRLNLIFQRDSKREILKPVILEYSRARKWWLRPFQYIYLKLAISSFFCKYFANAYLLLNRQIPDSSNYVFLGGNNHIRMLDEKAGTCVVIRKQGVDKRLLEREVRALSMNYSFVPTCLEADPHGEFYVEKLIKGIPINRLDATKENHYRSEAFQLLLSVYERTKTKTSLKEYIGRLSAALESLSHNDLLLTQHKSAIVSLISCGEIDLWIEEISLVNSHGDFQASNILLVDSAIQIIDWEYSTQRSVCYDLFVNILSVRSPEGLSKRISDAIDWQPSKVKTVCPLYFHEHLASTTLVRIALLVFVFEEVVLRLEELQFSKKNRLPRSHVVFFAELSEIANSLRNVSYA
jgi:hypothetical protein